MNEAVQLSFPAQKEVCPTCKKLGFKRWIEGEEYYEHSSLEEDIACDLQIAATVKVKRMNLKTAMMNDKSPVVTGVID